MKSLVVRGLWSLLLVPSACAALAQTLEAPVWSVHHWDKAPYKRFAPLCSGDKAFAFGHVASNSKRREDEGYIFPADGMGKPVVKKVTIPFQKDHNTFNRFFVFQGAPHVLYNSWEPETGKVTLFVQRYSPETFDPDGTPAEVGVVPFSPKTYYGAELFIRVYVSPDGSKVLFLFDDIQMDGVKLAMCWAMDEDLDLLWKGAYRVPVQSLGASISADFLDNGHLYLEVSAVVLDESNTKEKRDGSTVVKVDGKYWKHSSKTWYDLHGETFRMWDGTLPDGEVLKDAGLQLRNGRLSVGGFIASENKKNTPREWFLGYMDDNFKPVQLARGKVAAGGLPPAVAANLVVTPAGEHYLLGTFDETLVVIKFDAEHNKSWEKDSPWGMWIPAYWAGDRLVSAFMGKESDLKALQGGTKGNNTGYNLVPIVVSWDTEGKRTVQCLLPEGTKRVRNTALLNDPDFSSIERCGAYVDWSYDRDRPGVVRVAVR